MDTTAFVPRTVESTCWKRSNEARTRWGIVHGLPRRNTGTTGVPRLSLCRVLQIVQKVADLQDAISEGANSFLITEYKYMGVFMVCSHA